MKVEWQIGYIRVHENTDSTVTSPKLEGEVEKHPRQKIQISYKISDSFKE